LLGVVSSAHECKLASVFRTGLPLLKNAVELEGRGECGTYYFSLSDCLR